MTHTTVAFIIWYVAFAANFRYNQQNNYFIVPPGGNYPVVTDFGL